MTALANGIQVRRLPTDNVDSGPQKGSTVVYQGATIMIDTSGYIRPAAPSVSGAYCAGVALPRLRDLDRYDNSTGADGDLDVDWEEGIFARANDGGSPILATTQPMTILYAVDDNVVSLSSNGGLRPVAGRLYRLKNGVVYVLMSKAIGKQCTEELGLLDSGISFTQTYSTTTTTVPAMTSAALTNSTGGAADGTLAAVGVTNTGDRSADINNNFTELYTQYTALKADVLANRQLINSLIDVDQAAGIAS